MLTFDGVDRMNSGNQTSGIIVVIHLKSTQNDIQRPSSSQLSGTHGFSSVETGMNNEITS